MLFFINLAIDVYIYMYIFPPFINCKLTIKILFPPFLIDLLLCTCFFMFEYLAYRLTLWVWGRCLIGPQQMKIKTFDYLFIFFFFNIGTLIIFLSLLYSSLNSSNGFWFTCPTIYSSKITMKPTLATLRTPLIRFLGKRTFPCKCYSCAPCTTH